VTEVGCTVCGATGLPVVGHADVCGRTCGLCDAPAAALVDGFARCGQHRRTAVYRCTRVVYDGGTIGVIVATDDEGHEYEVGADWRMALDILDAIAEGRAVAVEVEPWQVLAVRDVMHG
jgi:hypothetical protein